MAYTELFYRNLYPRSKEPKYTWLVNRYMKSNRSFVKRLDFTRGSWLLYKKGFSFVKRSSQQIRW
jgi:hypothetical protein